MHDDGLRWNGLLASGSETPAGPESFADNEPAGRAAPLLRIELSRISWLLTDRCALSSAVEHFLHTEGVAGSNPAARTILRSEPTSGDSDRRMVSSVALAKEDSFLNSSELRMAGQS